MNETTLREVYARVQAARGSDRRACPSPETIRDLAAAQSHDERSADAFDHVMGCAACVREYELLRSVAVAERKAQPVRRVQWVPMALAASALLAVGLVATLNRPEQVMRGAAVDTDGTITVARGDSIRLVWNVVPGADAYRVELLDRTGVLLQDRTTSDTMVVFAPELVPLGVFDFDWLVVARRADGNEQRSPLRPLRVRP